MYCERCVYGVGEHLDLCPVGKFDRSLRACVESASNGWRFTVAKLSLRVDPSLPRGEIRMIDRNGVAVRVVNLKT